MPFTPFHFGPGLLLKSAAPQRVSVVSYAAANVLIDVETAYHLVRHDPTVHQWAHTFLGAGLVGLAIGAAMAFVASRVAAFRARVTHPGVAGELSPLPILAGAVLGAITHPLLDGVMHPDIHPFRPISDANPLLGLVNADALQTACVVSASLGAVILFARRARWTALACLMLIAPTATRVEFGNITPMRLGDAARQLPDQVVVEIERAAMAHGVTPWLIHGSGGQLANSQTIDAFGLPTVTTPSLRRGPVATLMRQRGTVDGLWQPWRLASRSEYAQVASDGQSLGWLEGEQDPGRPFRLTGVLADRDVVSLVAFIRSSPVVPGPGENRVRGHSPIVLIDLVSRQTGGAIDVVLGAGDRPGQRVTVRSQNGAWVVIGLRPWVL